MFFLLICGSGSGQMIWTDPTRSGSETLIYNIIFITDLFQEGACSEQSSRMTAMDNSTKNAGNRQQTIDSFMMSYSCFIKGEKREEKGVKWERIIGEK